MENNEIYIDGVNVAGCDGLNKKSLPLKQCDLLQFKTKNGGIAGRWCTDHSNCYYKQLKQLEQEDKELKEELNKVIDEREKKIEETLLKGCYQSLGSECRIYELKESKYRSALEEIKELLNLGICKNGVNGNCRPIRNTKKEDCYNAIYKVKDIIREVLS